MSALTSEAISQLLAADSSGMLELVTQSPRRGRQNYQLGRNLAFSPEIQPHQILVCGMGGSGSSGDLLAAISSQARMPVLVCKSPQLPAWVGPETLVICVSYSGNTQETLACQQQARAQGAQLLALASGGELAARAQSQGFALLRISGGLPPRSALFDMLFALLGALSTVLGLAPSEIEASLDRLDHLSQAWTVTAGQDDPLPLALSRTLQDADLLLWGSPGSEAIPLRWKNQLSENAKTFAAVSQLPELNHNEIVPMCAGHHSHKRLVYFTLENDIPPAEAVVLDLVKPHLQDIVTLKAEGASPVERLLHLVYLGDFTSVYLALIQNLDPTPIEAIDELKRRMAGT